MHIQKRNIQEAIYRDMKKHMQKDTKRKKEAEKDTGLKKRERSE